MSEGLYLQGITPEQLKEMMRGVVAEEVAKVIPEREEKLLSPADACKMFQPAISKSTLHNWTEKGLLQAHYLGGRKYYKQSEILSKLETLTRYKV